ncbi:PH domain-containing protein [Clostridium ljungdahlii]|uniref:Bacterial Pleckstrin homology domain-containing protein n=1 Tax=Clostridium ljungdahlii TaxID=1538 RepID=A0A168LR26_9CLOT|nr:PH domain-containing protein [Clostridium ljungdahlii]OAA83581.1 hypothetical protein WY13_03368 [Clostridium ljungdahlii]
MKTTYKSAKGVGVWVIAGITVVYNVFMIVLMNFINSYEIFNLFKLAFIAVNVYQIYYIIICGTLKYSMDEENLYITSMFKFKNEKIPFKDIRMYQKSNEYIKGVKLSGYGKSKFAIGRSFIHKVGRTYMFVTSTKNVIYLKTDDITYGISPENFQEFELKIQERHIENLQWENKLNKGVELRKEPQFFVPFIIAAVTVLMLTLNPIIMYLYGNLPDRMPLSFNPNFIAVEFGTGKQFAFKQMTYGLLNMGLLFCMYYAAYIFSKYDKKVFYKFIYTALVVAAFFLIMQIRILYTFK